MKRLAIVLMTCVLLLAPMPASTIETAQSDAPYIQYYSPAHDAFIIERADGTDSRLFGGEWIPEGTTRVAGAGWSPSGEWFAFLAAKRDNWHYEGLGAAAVNISGTKNVSALDKIENEPDFQQWFEHRDRLFISTISVGFDQSGETYYERQIYVIDAAANTILTSNTIVTWDPFPYIEWNSKFQTFIVTQVDFDSVTRTETVYLVDDEGMIQETPIKDSAFGLIDEAGWTVVREGDEERYIYNVFDNHRLELEEEARTVWFRDPFALYQTTNFQLLNLDTGEVNTLSRRYWTSKHNNPFSPDGTQIVFWNVQNQLFLMNPTTLEFSPIGISGEPTTNFDSDFGLYWDAEGRLIVNVFSRQESRTTIVDYDEIVVVPYEYFRGSISPDETMIGSVYEGATIYEMATGTTFMHQPHSQSFQSGPIGEVIWHSDGEWIIATQAAATSDGDNGSRWINVATVDGTVNRELTYCDLYEPVCASWLPDRVEVSQLPSSQPQSHLPEPVSPQFKLEMDEFVYGMAWSTAGRYLVMRTVTHGEIFLDVETNQTIEDIPNDVEFGELREIIVSGYAHTDAVAIREEQSDDDSGLQVYVVDLASDTHLFKLPTRYPILISEFTPDSEYLAIVLNWGDRLQIWDLTTQEMVYELPRGVSVFAISPDGTKLAAGVSWEVWIWDIEDLVGGD